MRQPPRGTRPSPTSWRGACEAARPDGARKRVLPRNERRRPPGASGRPRVAPGGGLCRVDDIDRSLAAGPGDRRRRVDPADLRRRHACGVTGGPGRCSLALAFITCCALTLRTSSIVHGFSRKAILLKVALSRLLEEAVRLHAADRRSTTSRRACAPQGVARLLERIDAPTCTSA